MTLKELKKMIAEEYSAFKRFNEQPGDMPELPGDTGGPMPAPTGGPDEPAVAVSDDDIDATGGTEGAEKTLKKMFDMLKDYFEGDDESPSVTKSPKDDKGGDDKKDDDKKDDDKEDKKDKEALQERFQKLANIIK